MTILSIVLLSLAKISTAIGAPHPQRTTSWRNAPPSLQLEANKFGAVPFANLATLVHGRPNVTRWDLQYTRQLTITPQGRRATRSRSSSCRRWTRRRRIRSCSTGRSPPTARRSARGADAHATTRRGFTLAEVMISLIIAGVIGAAFTKLLMSQNRYYDHETNLRSARSIARSATQRAARGPAHGAGFRRRRLRRPSMAS